VFVAHDGHDTSSSGSVLPAHMPVTSAAQHLGCAPVQEDAVPSRARPLQKSVAVAVHVSVNEQAPAPVHVEANPSRTTAAQTGAAVATHVSGSFPLGPPPAGV